MNKWAAVLRQLKTEPARQPLNFNSRYRLCSDYTTFVKNLRESVSINTLISYLKPTRLRDLRFRGYSKSNGRVMTHPYTHPFLFLKVLCDSIIALGLLSIVNL